MSLVVGTRLGPYEIQSAIGAGGMGEVYRARDTQLKRDVALKVLPADVGADADRLMRFQREAELLAALNHPHIAQIYGVAESEGVRALVMELVEGQTLAERIEIRSGVGGQGSVATTHGIPIDEALPIALQLADALDYAHERGIIHRDLKPANIKLTPDGAVKVLDFGLAKALDVQSGREAGGRGAGGQALALTDSPTITSPAVTRAGIILGTAAYMSPEQARGTLVDKRTDIWAFGVVLFEMLTGQACFGGETVTDVLASVVKGEPDWSALPAGTPPRVVDLLRRCLAKDRRQRLRDIGDVRLALDDGAPVTPVVSPSVLRASLLSRALPWAVAAALALVAGVQTLRSKPETGPVGQPVRHYREALPVPLYEFSGNRSVAISPDGGALAFVGTWDQSLRIYFKRLTDLDYRALAGTETTEGIVFSADGKWIAFSDGTRWKRLRLAGGQVEDMTQVIGEEGGGASWEADQKVYFASGWSGGISRVDATASAAVPELVLAPDPARQERGLLWPQRLPFDNLVLFTVFPGNIASLNDGRLAIADPANPAGRWTLPIAGTCARYLPSGHVVYGRDGNLMAASVDPVRRTISEPVVVTENVRMNSLTGVVQFAVSASGDLVYAEGGIPKFHTDLVRFDRSGTKTILASWDRSLTSPNFSPDGKQVLLTAHGANDDIDLCRLPEGSARRVTFEDGDERSPVWLPDGRRYVYSSEAGPVAKMFLGATDGRSQPEPLYPADSPRYASAVSQDGRFLFFQERSAETNWDIWVGALGPDRQARPFLHTKSAESSPALSPDGRWLVYQSDESGPRSEIYVVRFPEGTDKVQVSLDGGTEPRWAPKGNELYYRRGFDFIAVETAAGPSFSTGRRSVLFRAEGVYTRRGPQWSTYAVTPNGTGFIVIGGPTLPARRELVVVQNWFAELKAKVPVKR